MPVNSDRHVNSAALRLFTMLGNASMVISTVKCTTTDTCMPDFTGVYSDTLAPPSELILQPCGPSPCSVKFLFSNVVAYSATIV